MEEQIPNYNEREKYWIKKYNSKVPNGYNILDGGDEPPIHYGTDHPSSKLTDTELAGIKYDLKNTKISLGDIASKYNISKRSILRINQGINYEEIGETYPLRKEPNQNGKLTNDDVDLIIEILKYSYRQYEDIGKQFGVTGSAIKHINEGSTNKRDEEDYPIRKYKNSGVPALTYEQVTEISYLLLNSNISCNELSRKFNVKLNEIYLVNNGKSKRYHRDEYTYPLRKHNRKK